MRMVELVNSSILGLVVSNLDYMNVIGKRHLPLSSY